MLNQHNLSSDSGDACARWAGRVGEQYALVLNQHKHCASRQPSGYGRPASAGSTWAVTHTGVEPNFTE